MALTNNVNKLAWYANLDDKGTPSAPKVRTGRAPVGTITPTVTNTAGNLNGNNTGGSVFDDQVSASDSAYDTYISGLQTSLSEYQKTIADQQKQIDDLLQKGYGQAGTYLDTAYKSNTDALLKNYELQSKNNYDQYTRNAEELRASRDRQLQSANATLEMLQKYLPTMGRDGGLDLTGAASGALLRMQNANRSEVGSINANYDTNKVSLDNAYGERRTSLDTGYNTTKAGYDTAYNQGKADLSLYLTDAQASNAQHYGDLSANAGYETGNKVAEGGLDKYLSEAEIREKERTEARADQQREEQWAREDQQLKDAYEREDKVTFGNTLSSSLEDYIAGYSQTGDGKMSRTEFETLKGIADKYYDELDDAGKLAVDSALSRAEKLIRTDAQQAAYERSESESVAIKDAQANRKVAVMDSVTSNDGIRLGYKREDGSIGDMSEATADVTKYRNNGSNFTITIDGEEFKVEQGVPMTAEANKNYMEQYKSLYGSDPKIGGVSVANGRIYVCVADEYGNAQWVTVLKRSNSYQEDWAKLRKKLGIK